VTAPKPPTLNITLTHDGAKFELTCEHGVTAAEITGDPESLDTPEGALQIQLDHHRIVGCYCTPEIVYIDGGPRLN
jgi:hypothetical protein